MEKVKQLNKILSCLFNYSPFSLSLSVVTLLHLWWISNPGLYLCLVSITLSHLEHLLLYRPHQAGWCINLAMLLPLAMIPSRIITICTRCYWKSLMACLYRHHLEWQETPAEHTSEMPSRNSMDKVIPYLWDRRARPSSSLTTHPKNSWVLGTETHTQDLKPSRALTGASLLPVVFSQVHLSLSKRVLFSVAWQSRKVAFCVPKA